MIKISTSIKDELRAYYQSTAAPIDEAEKAHVVRLVSEVAASLPAADRPRSMPLWRFLVGQLRFVNPLTWVAQIALLAGMLLLVSAYGGSGKTTLVVMIAAVLSVAIAVPSVFKSYECNMAELETSCQHDSVQVLVSRLVLFGLADVLWISLSVCLVPALAGGDPFRVFFYASTPFFAFCALCFYLSRITNGRCMKACIVAAACMIAGLWIANELFPQWYSDASLIVWSCALVVAVALAAYEVQRLLKQIASSSIARAAHRSWI